MPLRERKKAITRASLVAIAERLFEERGYDNVTVAEIADAANVAVKTLFAYFPSKEDLAFADTWLLDTLLAALRDRKPEEAPASAVAEALVVALHADPRGAGLDDYHRGFGDSPALRSRLLRMWDDYEQQIAAALSSDLGQEGSPELRLYAMHIIGLVRVITSPQMRQRISQVPSAAVIEALTAWLREAARRIDAVEIGSPIPMPGIV